MFSSNLFVVLEKVYDRVSRGELWDYEDDSGEACSGVSSRWRRDCFKDKLKEFSLLLW